MTRQEYLQTATKPIPERYCAYCGKKLERKRFSHKWEDLAVFSKRKYCDRECMKRAFLKTGQTDQSKRVAHHTSMLMMRLLQPEVQECQICKSTKNLDVHHKDGNFRNNTIENLMLLCRSCHMKEHHPKGTCMICGEPVKGHNLCSKHYQRWKKCGRPTITDQMVKDGVLNGRG